LERLVLVLAPDLPLGSAPIRGRCRASEITRAMVGTPASRANIHRPDGKVERDVTLLEVPRAVEVIMRRGRRWLIVEVRPAGGDDAAKGILHDIMVEPVERG
jgi:hypothetical protein